MVPSPLRAAGPRPPWTRLAASIYATALLVYTCCGELWLIGRYMGYGISAAAIRTYDMRLLPGFSSDWNATYWWCAFAGWPLLGALTVALAFSVWRRRPARVTTGALTAATVAVAVGLMPVGPLRQLPVWPPSLGSLAGFERMSGMSLPPGTVLVEARGYKGWRQVVQARLLMPRAQVRRFVDTSFAASVTWSGGEHPKPETEQIPRSQLQHGWYFIYGDWYHPASATLTAVSVVTNDGSDNHQALILVEPGATAMADVFLQYDRG